MRASELDYDLPPELIAQEPCSEREAARLLTVTAHGGEAGLGHRRVGELPELLTPALFVLNDTRVIPARILGTRPSGGSYEILLVERLAGEGDGERWLAMGRPLKSLKPGLRLSQPGLEIELGARRDGGFVEVLLRAEGEGGVLAALERVGHVPLPPYIQRADDRRDLSRYQTVFAREPGAVAAPTASLHFGESLLAALRAAGHELSFITLHVGPGTFAPLAVDDLAEHPMHEERYAIPEATAAAIARAKAAGRPVVAVGTTVVRSLESAARPDGSLAIGPGRTRLCIYPPYTFKVVDALVTNFHLPRSTLLALVMAFAGVDTTRAAYAAAVRERYRFFSYGDAMFVSPARSEP